MTSMLYNNPQAGLNAFRLMEDLSELHSPAGWAEMRKTMRSERASDTREYPPVYEVYFAPNQHSTITSEWLARLEALAVKYEAKVEIASRSGWRGVPELVARFKAR